MNQPSYQNSENQSNNQFLYMILENILIQKSKIEVKSGSNSHFQVQFMITSMLVTDVGDQISW